MVSQVTWMCIVVFLDIVGIALVAPLLPMIARDMGLSHTQWGVIGSLYGLAQVFSGPVMGAVSDVMGRKRVFLISIAGATAAYCMLGAADVTKSLALLALSRVIVGLVKQTMTIAVAFITDETSPDQRTSALGTLFALSNVAFIVGAPVGGVLSSTCGGFCPVMLSSVLYAAAFALCFFKVEDRGGSLGFKQVCPSLAAKGLSPADYANQEAPHALPAQSNIASSPRPILSSVRDEFEGLLTDMWRNVLVRQIATASLLSTLSMVLVQASFTMVAKEKFDLTNRTATYIVSYQALVNAFVLYFLSAKTEKLLRSLNCNTNAVYPFAALLTGGSLVLQAKTGSLGMCMGLMLFAALGDALFKVHLSSLFTKLYEAEIGAASGLFGTIESVCRIFAPLLSGLLLDMGASMPWTFAGCLNIILAGYCYASFSTDAPDADELRSKTLPPRESKKSA
ncbi:Tetracycline resistance protein [Diplonema papillatum]|nr:Tetracycline resistance protein [Diplonema papillatum]